MKKFSHAVVGGTFDRFHKGHEKLIEATFNQSEQVVIGVSTEKLYKHKLLASTIESFEIREQYIMEFLKNKNIEKRAKIIAIDDIYGTTLQNKDIDAIFITEENIKAADLINQNREKLGFSSLFITVVPFVKAQDGQNITSERIRKGEIDREGNVYGLRFKNKNFHLPSELRAQLRNPIGVVVQDIKQAGSIIDKAPFVFTVGDIVTLSLIETDKPVAVGLVDFKTQRHELNQKQVTLINSLNPGFVCKNTPGKIENEAVEALQGAIDQFLVTKEAQIIKVLGEEDLLTLPAVLLAPLESLVLYGQFDEGAVVVQVTEEKKKEISLLLDKFEQT